MQAQGTTLLAYLSMLEVPDETSAVLRIDGVPQQNRAWGNWILDPRHPETERRVLAAAAALRHDGWDGIFLDTLGILESPALLTDLELVPAAARLVAAIAAGWPGGVLVQNWGLGLLLPLTAPYLQGVCWEDFPHAQLAAGDPQFTRLARRLQAWAAKGLHVLALNEDGTGGHVAEAWGFPWYGAPGAYTRLPHPQRRTAPCEPATP
jgi:hypothetical protein